VAGDTQVRFTAAFIHSGPLQPPALLFGGAVAAYLPIRYSSHERRVGNVSGVELALYTLTFVVLVLFLGWPGFWYQDSCLRDLANQVHSATNDISVIDDPIEIDYAQTYFTSPLRGYVLAHNVYILFSALLAVGIAWAVWALSRNAPEAQRSDIDARGSVRTGFLWTLRIFTVILALAALSHVALCIAAIFFHWIGPGDGLVIMLNTSVLLSAAAFLTGWLLAFLFTSRWWTDPAKDGEFAWKVISAFVTALVGAVATVFGSFLLVELFTDCNDTIFSQVEGDSALKEFVCRFIDLEERDHKVLFYWHVGNAFAFTIASAAISLTSAISGFLIRRQ